jgi:hypothetical protein
MGEVRNAYNIFIGKSEGKRLCGKHRHRWEDSIRMDLREVGQKGVVSWIH